MTNSASPREYLVTSCPDHGVKVTLDLASARLYVDATRVCHLDRDRAAHAREHALDGTDCWSCCSRMVVDPERKF